MFLQVAMILALIAVADPFAPWVELLVGATVALTVVSGLDVRVSARSRSATPPGLTLRRLACLPRPR